jgi:predicted phosphodiesterase
MKILCLSDIHDQFTNYKPAELPDADIVLLAGGHTDLGVRGEMRGIGTMGRPRLGSRRWATATPASSGSPATTTSA